MPSNSKASSTNASSTKGSQSSAAESSSTRARGAATQGGRGPTPDQLTVAARLWSQGKRSPTIAEALGVHPTTIQAWAKDHPDWPEYLEEARALLTEATVDQVRRASELAWSRLIAELRAGGPQASTAAETVAKITGRHLSDATYGERTTRVQVETPDAAATDALESFLAGAATATDLIAEEAEALEGQEA